MSSVEFFLIIQFENSEGGFTDVAIKIAQITVLLLTTICSGGISASEARVCHSGFTQCSQNPDHLYDRRVLHEKFDNILKASIPAYAQFPSRGFFVYDLNDPTNKYIPALYAQGEACINFIDNHVYHFAPVEFAFSQSHLAVLERGQLKIFTSINCKDSNEHLSDVIAYMNKRLKGHNRKELVTRIRQYRKYGFYINTDSPRVPCNGDEEDPPKL